MELYLNNELPIKNRDLYTEIHNYFDDTSSEIRIELRPRSRQRGGIPIDPNQIDPNLIVAVVAGLGSGLGSLIAVLSRVISGRRPEGKIVVEISSEKKVEFPSHMSVDEINQLINKAKLLDGKIQRISLL